MCRYALPGGDFSRGSGKEIPARISSARGRKSSHSSASAPTVMRSDPAGVLRMMKRICWFGSSHHAEVVPSPIPMPGSAYSRAVAATNASIWEPENPAISIEVVLPNSMVSSLRSSTSTWSGVRPSQKLCRATPLYLKSPRPLPPPGAAHLLWNPVAS